MALREHNYNIDTAKFIAALFVVSIHTSAYLFIHHTATFKNFFVYRGLLDIAVPLFFAISGYLIAKKNVDKMKIYTKKIVLLFAFSTILFIIFRFLINIITAPMNHISIYESIAPTLKIFTVDNLISGVLGWGHLWYLSASAFACLLLIFFLQRKYTPLKILRLSIILYIVSMSSLISFPPLTYAGGVPLALACMSIGIYVAKNKRRAPTPKRSLAYFTLLLSTYIIGQWLSAPAMLSLLLPAAVYYLMILLASPGKKTLVSNLGKYSLWIYILHPIFVETLYTIVYPQLHIGERMFSLRVVLITIVLATSLSISLSIPMEKLWGFLQRKYLLQPNKRDEEVSHVPAPVSDDLVGTLDPVVQSAQAAL